MPRKLVIDETEAKTVRKIFQIYGELGTVRRVKEETDRLGIVTKHRVQKNGKRTGGKPFSRGNLYQFLSNPIYVGRIPHKGETYPGEHDAIVDPDIWNNAQSLLAQNATNRTQSTNAKGPFLLTGKVFDENGESLYQSQAHKRGKRYCYYISKHLMHGVDEYNNGWRIPAKALEVAVIEPLLEMVQCQSRVMDIMCLKDPGIASINSLQVQALRLAHQLGEGKPEDKRNILQAIVQRINLAPKSITLVIDKSGLAQALNIPRPDDTSPESIKVPVRLQRRGVETKLIIESPNAETRNLDNDLCHLIAQAHLWFGKLTSGEAPTVREIAAREQVNEHEITRILHLAFLSPRIVEDILDGRQAEGVGVHRLRRLSSIPSDWADQAKLLENLR